MFLLYISYENVNIHMNNDTNFRRQSLIIYGISITEILSDGRKEIVNSRTVYF